MRTHALFSVVPIFFGLFAGLACNWAEAQTIFELRVLQHQQGPNDLCSRFWMGISKIDAAIQIQTIPPRATNSRSEAALKDGQADADCGRIKTDLRAEHEIYSQIPLLTINIVAISRKDDPEPIRSWDDLIKISASEKILINQASPFVSKLRDHGIVNIDDSAVFSENNLAKLANHRGRVFIHRSPGIDAKIRDLNLTEDLRISAPLDKDELFVVYSDQLSAPIRQRVEKAIESLRKSGELARITSVLK